MLKTLLLFLFIALLSCKQETSNDLTGTYESIRYSVFERPLESLKRINDRRAVGTTLILNSDSSYQETTCGNIMTGTWRVKNDSLLLFCENNRWRIDSLQVFGFNGTWPGVPEKPQSFFIDGTDLLQSHSYPDSTGKTITSHYDLEKIK